MYKKNELLIHSLHYKYKVKSSAMHYMMQYSLLYPHAHFCKCSWSFRYSMNTIYCIMLTEQIV